MLILEVILDAMCSFCKITSSGRTYACPQKEEDGEFYFYFKRKWHKVDDYVSEWTIYGEPNDK